MKRPRYTDDDGRFDHVDLHRTNVAATFARVRRRLAEEAAAREREAATKVRPIKRGKA